MDHNYYSDGTITTGWNAAYPFEEVLESTFPEVGRATLVTWPNTVLFTESDLHQQLTPCFFRSREQNTTFHLLCITF